VPASQPGRAAGIATRFSPKPPRSGFCALNEKSSLSSRTRPKPPKARNDFDMRRMAKLIYGLNIGELKAAATEDRGVAGKSFGIAGNARDKRHSGRCKRAGLALGPQARRIEDRGVKNFEFIWAQRLQEKVAPRHLNWL
jgi:hypothetical protein